MSPATRRSATPRGPLPGCTTSRPIPTQGVSFWAREPYERHARHEADYPLSFRFDETDTALYERFYAGNSIIVRNQSDREAPWEKFHATVDGLLARVEAPRV
jgi:hypothetical protein